MQDSDTYFGAPSLRMWSNGGTFTAGILTQVGDVQPGATYVASWGWGGPNDPDTFGRKLGIDPTGGTDPLSPNVIWGPLHYGPGRILNRPGPYSPGNPNLNVAAVAQSSTVTVFVWVEHPRSTGDNLIFIDQVGPAPGPQRRAAAADGRAADCDSAVPAAAPWRARAALRPPPRPRRRSLHGLNRPPHRRPRPPTRRRRRPHRQPLPRPRLRPARR